MPPANVGTPESAGPPATAGITASTTTMQEIADSPWPGIIKLSQARETLVSDIPAGDGKIAYLF
jgi:hypothetical protein